MTPVVIDSSPAVRADTIVIPRMNRCRHSQATPSAMSTRTLAQGRDAAAAGR